MRNKSSTLPIALTILLLLALCCLCISLVLFAGGTFIINQQWSKPTSTQTLSPIQRVTPTHIPSSILETNVHPTKIPLEQLEQIKTPIIAPQQTTLDILNAAVVPINDPIDLAHRLGGKTNITKALTDPLAPYQVGASKSFWVTNVDDNQNFSITATLRYAGAHMYFWIQDEVDYYEEDLQTLANEFEGHIFPTTQALFGDEWAPGLDGDPRIHILYASGLGQSLAGYFSSVDQLPPQVHEFSNGHEMFLINADTVFLWNKDIYSTLAHELQHMIHWHIDRNEETWLNEGFSMLTELVNGYDPSGFDFLYVQKTDLQLTDWGTTPGSNGPHYGASMLFATYFFDRFGKEATQLLIAESQNGMQSITTVLDNLGFKDPLTNKIITAEDLFADWAIANALGNLEVGDGRYHYRIYPNAPLAKTSDTISTCPIEPLVADVAQFGVDYIRISCPGEHTVIFKGENKTNLLPVDPFSGNNYFWSNKGDQSNTSLQRAFDLTHAEGPIEMTFQTWYDLEAGYDYAFVSASVDGITWQILNTSSCTYSNPSGNSYGCGFNGKSNGWQQETIDLTPFAGSQVSIRFDYVTDAAVNGDGLLIDDIRLDAIDYFTDFENDAGGWQAEGFARVQNELPQDFRVSLITFGEQIEVKPLILDENNQAEVILNLGSNIDSVIFVVSGTTPYTRQRARYQMTID